MSRIPLADLDSQPEAIREFVARRGRLDVFRLLANAPQAFAGWTQMVDELADSTTFSLRQREIVILRVAHLQGSRYELGQHIGIARDAGLSEQQIEAALGDPATADLSSTERLLLELTGELCATHRLSEHSFTTGRTVLGDSALTELLMLVSCYYGLALVLNAAELDVDASARFRL